MKKIRQIVLILLAVAMLVMPGCFPKALTWSPDGKSAAICTEDGLYFTDAQGKISNVVCTDVGRIAWLHDSEHLLVEKVLKCKSWSEIEQKVASELKSEIVQKADEFGKVTQEQQWYDLREKYQSDDNEICGIELYLKSTQGDWSEVVKSHLEGDKEYLIYNVTKASWKDGTFTTDKVLCQFAEPVWEMYVSANNKYAVTVAMADKSSPPSSLWLIDLVNGGKKLIDTNVSLYPAWQADSRHVVYTRAVGDLKDDASAGNIVQVELIDNAGNIKEEPQEKTLAALMMGRFTKVHCLTDGRVLFSSVEITMPVATDDGPSQMQLFMLDTTRSSSVSRVMLRSSQEKLTGYAMDFFDVSGNRRFVSLITNENQLSVYDMVNGEVTLVQAEKQGDLRSLPSWRGESELCYLERGEKNRVMLLDMTTGQKRCISDTWPDEVIDKIEAK